MKKLFKTNIGLILSIVATNNICAQLNIDDYCNLSYNTPSSLREMTPMDDGESYASCNEEGTKIELFSFKSGKQTGVLFDVNQIKGDLKITDFEGFKVSDNGKKILLWNNSEKIYRRSFIADFYVYDTFRNTLAKVSEEGHERGATMSHDGRYVAYVRDNNIHIANLDYKTDLKITDDGNTGLKIYGVPDWSYEEEFGIDNTIRWNNDDTLLIFVCFDESNVPVYSFDQYSSYCNGSPLDDLYPASYNYKYPLAGYPCAKVSVYSYDLDNRLSKKLDIPMADDDYLPVLEFDGKGKQVMAMTLNKDQNQIKLYSVNPTSTVSRFVMEESSDTWLSPSSYQMIKFYDTTFVIGSERTGTRHLFLYDYNGTMKNQLTKGDYNVTDYYGKDALGTHYMQTTSLGAINRNIASVSIKGGFKLLNKREGWESAVFSKTMKYYLSNYSNSVTPPIYSLCNNTGAQTVVLEKNTAYAEKYMNAPKMEFLEIPNAIGELMNAFIIKPTNFDSAKKYPLVMYQYNGPESQEVTNKWKMEGIFYLASKGYVIACVDGRGTGNRNTKWTKCVYKHLGEYETLDQLAAASYLSKLPYIDASRMGCFGWSYGGYMTMMEMGNKECKFKAGVSMAGVSDWRFYDAPYTERFMLTPQRNKEGYEQSSALRLTNEVKGRLLLMSGANDDNVHMFNTLTYASKLSSEGGIVDMMIYPGYEHSLRMCDARTQLFRKIEDFFSINLK